MGRVILTLIQITLIRIQMQTYQSQKDLHLITATEMRLLQQMLMW